MTTEYSKPLPRPANAELSKPFWDATKKHEVVLPRCNKCSNTFFYPRETCPNCLSNDLDWSKASGRGRVHTFTIVEQPVHRGFMEDVPHVYAIIQLDEGVRLPSNVVDCAVDDVYIDMPVVAVFDDVTPDVTLVKFKPA